MLHHGHYKQLCWEYELGDYNSASPAGGNLNWNFVLTTDTGNYFVKCHRQKSADNIHRIQSTEQFFAHHGIPVILPIPNRSDDLHDSLDGTMCTVYPYITHVSAVRSALQPKQITQMGRLLAEIHRISAQHDIPAELSTVTSKPVDISSFLDQCQHYLSVMDSMEDTDLHRMYREILDYKIAYWQGRETTDMNPDYVRDTLIHGDLHELNVIFDTDNTILHTFDLELSKMDSRYRDVIKSLYKMFFDSGDMSDHSYNQAALFLREYDMIYPMDKQLFTQHMHLYFLDKFGSLWLENTYLRDGDTRVNIFIPGYHTLTRICADDSSRKDLVQKIVNLIN